jgi:hypothetical protein
LDQSASLAIVVWLTPNSLAISTSLSAAAPAVIERDPSEMKTPNESKVVNV